MPPLSSRGHSTLAYIFIEDLVSSGDDPPDPLRGHALTAFFSIQIIIYEKIIVE